MCAGSALGQARHDRRVIAADRDDHLVGGEIARRGRDVRSRRRGDDARCDGHAFEQRRVERCGEALEVVDDLVARHEAVRIVAGVRQSPAAGTASSA